MLAELKREWKFDIEAMVRPPLHTALDHVAMPSPPYPLATCGSTHGMLSSPHTSLGATWHALLTPHFP